MTEYRPTPDDPTSPTYPPDSNPGDYTQPGSGDSDATTPSNTTTPSGGGGGDSGAPDGLQELIGADVTLDLMDPAYLALLTDRFGTEDQRTGVLWNYFRYGVPYDPTEEVWVDADGNVVDDAQMQNPDYVEGSSEQTLNPAHAEYISNYDPETDGAYNPPPEYITTETEGQGDQYRTDLNITPSTRGDVEGYDPEATTSEADLIQGGFDAEGRLLPLREDATREGLNADIATSNLTETDANRAVDLITFGEENGLGEQEILAQLAEAGFTEADANYAKELVGYRRDTGVDTAGIDLEKQSIADQSLAMDERAPVREALYTGALEGLDTEKYARQAASEVSKTWDAGREGLNTSLALRGGAPTAENQGSNMERTALISSAKTGGRNWAEQESFNRLSSALNTDTMSL